VCVGGGGALEKVQADCGHSVVQQEHSGTSCVCVCVCVYKLCAPEHLRAVKKLSVIWCNLYK
jgi:hypothetical protein